MKPTPSGAGRRGRFGRAERRGSASSSSSELPHAQGVNRKTKTYFSEYHTVEVYYAGYSLYQKKKKGFNIIRIQVNNQKYTTPRHCPSLEVAGGHHRAATVRSISLSASR